MSETKEVLGAAVAACALFALVNGFFLLINQYARKNLDLSAEELIEGYKEYVRNVFIWKLNGWALLFFFALYLIS